MRVIWLLGLMYAFGANQTSIASNEVVKHDVKIKCVNSSVGTCVLPIFALYAGDLSSYSDVQIITTEGLNKRPI
jgi:hypothetical protein